MNTQYVSIAYSSGAFTLSALSPQADAIITRLFADILVSPEHKFESNLTAKEIKASTNARAWMRDKVVDVYMKILQRYLSEAGSSNIVLLSPDFYNSIGGTAQTGKALVDKENVCNGIHIAANFLAAERILVPAFLPSKSHLPASLSKLPSTRSSLVDTRFAHEDNSKDDNGLLQSSANLYEVPSGNMPG